MNRNQAAPPPPGDYEMIVVSRERDDADSVLLYGHQFLEQISKTGKAQSGLKVVVPAEAYFALLEKRFSHASGVRELLAAVEATGMANPDGNGQLLKAVSNAIELREEDFSFLDGLDESFLDEE
jgi:hypothetical protein